MDVKYQIFISSTFEDLKDERRAVTEAVLNLGHIPVGMELFQASNEDQWTHIQRRILDCDYYLVVVGERYGSELDGKSYTQMEYEFAVEHGVPVAGFLLDGEARKSWAQNRCEPQKADKVDAFRKLCQGKLVKFWRNPEDLALKVSGAIAEMTRAYPGIGWVKGNNLPSDRVLEELSKLSEEKRALQEKLDTLSQDRTLSVTAEEHHILESLDKIPLIDFFPSATDFANKTLLEVFLALSRKLVTCHCEFPPDWIRVRPIKGRTNEEAEIYGRADYCGAEGAGGWREGCRPLPQARNFRSNVL